MATPNYIIREQLGSRSYQYEGGRVTASRVFKVWDSANALAGLLNASDVRALFGSASTGVSLPIGDVWDEQYLPSMGDLFPEETGVYAYSYSLQREAGGDHWLVTWSYKNSIISPSQPQPNEPNYVEWTIDISAGFAEQWIENPRYPTNGTISTTDGQNIITGGQQRDIEGAPVSVLRLTTDINISETVESIGGLPAIYTSARAARGKRNSSAWQGISKGQALYLGASVRRIGVNLYQITHRIQEAADFHLLQYPRKDNTGNIATEVKNGEKRAKQVLWRQPFPDFYDFDSISSNW